MPDSPMDASHLLLYGVLDAAACDDEALQATLDRPGVQGAPLSLLPCGPLSVLVSPVDDPTVLRSPDVDRVLAYNEVVEAAYEVRSLLPLRFGTKAETPEAARRLIRQQAEACSERLAYLEERVEMGIRLHLCSHPESPSQGADVEAGSGASYLRARKEAYARTQRPLRDALQTYRSALEDLWIDVSHDEPEAGEQVFSGSFLVPRRDVDAFVRRAEAVEVSSELRGPPQVLGPWAPFTFASLSL